jgi:hypothetical protein
MKNIVHEQIKNKDFNSHHIRYIYNDNKLYVVVYNKYLDKFNNYDIEYESKGIADINLFVKYNEL